MLDTGASCSCLDPVVANYLGLMGRGIADIVTPSTGQNPHTATEHDMAIVIPPALPEDMPLIMECLPVIESELLATQGVHSLIGRDVLQKCIFHYNGSGYFSLAW